MKKGEAEYYSVQLASYDYVDVRWPNTPRLPESALFCALSEHRMFLVDADEMFGFSPQTEALHPFNEFVDKVGFGITPRGPLLFNVVHFKQVHKRGPKGVRGTMKKGLKPEISHCLLGDHQPLQQALELAMDIFDPTEFTAFAPCELKDSRGESFFVMRSSAYKEDQVVREVVLNTAFDSPLRTENSRDAVALAKDVDKIWPRAVSHCEISSDHSFSAYEFTHVGHIHEPLNEELPYRREVNLYDFYSYRNHFEGDEIAATNFIDQFLTDDRVDWEARFLAYYVEKMIPKTLRKDWEDVRKEGGDRSRLDEPDSPLDAFLAVHNDQWGFIRFISKLRPIDEYPEIDTTGVPYPRFDRDADFVHPGSFHSFRTYTSENEDFGVPVVSADFEAVRAGFHSDRYAPDENTLQSLRAKLREAFLELTPEQIAVVFCLARSGNLSLAVNIAFVTNYVDQDHMWNIYFDISRLFIPLYPWGAKNVLPDTHYRDEFFLRRLGIISNARMMDRLHHEFSALEKGSERTSGILNDAVIEAMSHQAFGRANFDISEEIDFAAYMPEYPGGDDARSYAKLVERAAFIDLSLEKIQQKNYAICAHWLDRFSPRVSEVLATIRDGETASVEFKSTYRWSLHKNDQDPELAEGIWKTITGFLNTDGGRLFIGVADNSDLLGLDLRKEGFRNADKFQNHLIDVTQNRLSSALPYINVNKHQFGEKLVIEIACKKFPELSAVDLQATKNSESSGIHIRVSATNRKLEGRELVEWSQNRLREMSES